MNHITFSLFGQQNKYVRGLFKNIELARKFYPNWKCCVWHDDEIDGLHEELIEEGADSFPCFSQYQWLSPYAWRFLVNDLPGCERWISRDCDSRIGKREADAVQIWIESGKPFHILRDHPNHGIYPIQAGMFGCKQGFIHDITYLMRMFRIPDQGYLWDQHFLQAVIWPRAKTMALQQGSCSAPFPGMLPLPPRDNNKFIGCRYDENDNPNPEDVRTLK